MWQRTQELRQAEAIAAKARAGEKVDILKVAWVAKYYPELLQGAKSSPRELKEEEYKLKEHIAPTLESVRGEPRLSTIMLMEAARLRATERFLPGSFPKASRGAEFAAGLVTTGEATMEIAFPHPTPRPEHHTLTGLPRQSGPFLAGWVAGEIAQGYVLGKVLEPATSEVAKWAGKTKPGQWLAKKGKAASEALHKSRVYQKWFEATGPHYKAAGEISRGVVSLPYTEAVSMKSLEAQQAAWALTEAPRTSGVMLWKTPQEITKRTILPHLFARAGMISKGYLAELGGFQRARHYDPFPSAVKEVTVTETVSPKAALPFIPTMMPSKAAASFPSLLFLGAPLTVEPSQAKEKTKVKEMVPTPITETVLKPPTELMQPPKPERMVQPREESFYIQRLRRGLLQPELSREEQKQSLILVPKIISRTQQVTELGVPQLITPAMTQIETPIETPITTTTTVLKPPPLILEPPTTVKPPTLPSFPDGWPRAKRRRRKRAPRGYSWVFRKWPIMEWKEVLGMTVKRRKR